VILYDKCDCHRRRVGVLCLSMRHLRCQGYLISRVGPHDRGHQISIIYRSMGPWDSQGPILLSWDSDSAGGRLLSTDTGLADLLPLGVLNTSAVSTISSYGSISIPLSSIVTNKGKTKYVTFYLLLANSITAFNNQQYRRFPSIFRVEYEVGNWPLTGSIGIRKSGSYYRIRSSTRLTPASLKADNLRNHRRLDLQHC